MRKCIIKGICLALVLTMALGFTNIVNAESIDKSTSGKNLTDLKENINVKDEINTEDGNITVITDSKELEKLKKEFGVVEPKGKKLARIELYEPKAASDANGALSAAGTTNPSLVWDYYIKSVTDLGTGWYFPDDPYMDNWWDGPDTATISQTQTFKAEANLSIGVTAAEITSSVGFTIGAEYSVTLSSTTPVPDGYTLEVKTYVTYQRKDYDVWADNIGTPDTYYATGSAYKPLGSYFAKFWYTN